MVNVHERIEEVNFLAGELNGIPGLSGRINGSRANDHI
jgi:hypothetical protein